jgi:hypothetical protein
MCESYSLSGHFVNTHKAQILTFQLSGNAYFALDNAEIWINSTALSAWIASNNSFTPSRGGTPYSSRSSSAHRTSHSCRSSIDAPSPFSVPSPYDADIIIASDGNPMLPPASHYRKRALSLGDSEDDSRPTCPTQRLLKKRPETKRARASKNAELIKITTKCRVEKIEELDCIPSTWDVPRVPTAFILDLSNIGDALHVSGEEKSLDAFIRSEECLSIYIVAMP